MAGCFRRGWLVAVGLLACRGPLETPGGELAPEAEAPAERGGAPEAQQNPVESEGGAAPALTLPGNEAQAGSPATAEGCSAEAVTLEEVHAGRVRSGFAVSLPELVASSQKFLVSEAKSGSCLWGAFAAEPGRSGAGSGLFLVSFGAPHEAGQACQSGSDGLPDDLTPGDRLEVQGFLDEYAPAACDGVAPAQQLRIDASCAARRLGSGDPPAAAPLDAALADRLAAGQDRELLRAWGGALVELEALSALQDPDDADAVFPFGVVRLAETALEVHSRLYYFDLSEGGPRDARKAPAFAYPTQFERLRGVVFLDYCTWALGPRERCHDLAPPSAGCAPQARGP